MSEENEIDLVAKNIPNAPVPQNVGIAAIALQMAMKYTDISMVKDVGMYTQYKIEGRTIKTIDLADVFDLAIKIEAHLVGGEDRIQNMFLQVLDQAIDGVLGDKRELDNGLQALRDGRFDDILGDDDKLVFKETQSGEEVLRSLVRDFHVPDDISLEKIIGSTEEVKELSDKIYNYFTLKK